MRDHSNVLSDRTSVIHNIYILLALFLGFLLFSLLGCLLYLKMKYWAEQHESAPLGRTQLNITSYDGFNKSGERYPQKFKYLVNKAMNQRYRLFAESRLKGWRVRVLSYLYLGNRFYSRNFVWMLEDGITHVINVADNVPSSWWMKITGKIKEQHFYIKDKGRDPGIHRIFPQVIQMVSNIKKNHFETESCQMSKSIKECGKTPKVLIHCVGGKSRSMTIVLMLLMKIEQMTLKQAVNYLLPKMTSKQPRVHPGTDMIVEIMMFEKELYHLKEPTMNLTDFYNINPPKKQ